ncbi:NAD-dependent epimerase/dehydratase family protein [Chromobacterium haemolyticum]|uniref:GDP-L-fucose synthase n=1 Tax=Chromobacterium haemolyticum TaxID=394935 RepID=A0A1W0CV43_9NEIS|nr:NAD-dependent epimerase/dehydratase family protein [Chromobacterium haemolyticum]OQS38644.1 GDP-L-fucose synthetase [Chromobacterium haemolyticum]
MILVTGCTGFLGKRVCKSLDTLGLPYTGISQRTGPDLRDRQATLDFFSETKPSKILNCAAFVGGIQFGYKHPAELFHNNLTMTLNLLEAAYLNQVKRIVNPISNCAYPGSATFFKEDEFWDGPLHESVMVYGFARKASWVGAWAYAKQYGLDVVNLILSNMYGPEDHFEEERSHALGALIMKIVKAKQAGLPQVIVWGSGTPVREWLHVDDGAEAMIRALDISSITDPVNIGVGRGISILEMATLIKNLVGYQGDLVLDRSKPDGAPYKTVDGSRGAQHFGWSPQRDFKQGIAETIDWYLEHGVQHG